MRELVRAVRSRPQSDRVEIVLTTEDQRFVLTVGGGARRATSRELAGPDLATALASAHELISTDPVTFLEVTCIDAGVHDLVVASLRDSDPDEEFTETAWPEGTSGLPATDEWPIDEVVRHRWISIDARAYHLLPVDRTRAVHVDEGKLCSGEELASATWSFDGDISSSVGSETLRVIGGDMLVRQNVGDDFPETVVEPFGGDPVIAVVTWLNDFAHAAPFLVDALPMPGLTGEERRALTEMQWQSVSVNVDEGRVIDELCVDGERHRFRRALAEPGSEEGTLLYAVVRDVLAGDAAFQGLLERII